eukprot:GHUV01005746.1.p1 GENE.GHUV01005746.1~~GHUV01005746.1.p1  ORF type:complete len:403 (+),score=134.31 GHUV01005746.1:292-1500(+)
MLGRSLASVQQRQVALVPRLPAPVQRPKRVMCRSSLTWSETPLQTAQYAKELEAACQAVQLASKLCRTVQQQLTTAEKTDKQDDSPVTVADYGAQALVAWVLQRSDPSVRLSMVAEEDATDLKSPSGGVMLTRITQLINTVLEDVPDAEQLTEQQVVDLIELGGSNGGRTGRHWVLDPIDGTRGFVGMRQYAVCLGMLQDGDVLLGVLGCPNLPQGRAQDDDGGADAASRSSSSDVGVLFLAHRGCGAYAAPLPQQPTPLSSSSKLTRIHVQDVTDMSGARFMESFESRHSDHSFTAAVAKQAGVTLPPLRMDSQVKYGLLSRGDAGIFMRFPPPAYREKIWDHCAGFCIVEEAGGKVTDGSGARLDFARGRWLDLDGGIIAAPPAVHEAVLKAVQTVRSKM